MSKQLVAPMEFYKVDKITDDVYAIAPNVVLRFSVSLSKMTGEKRYHFHREYEYPVKGMNGIDSLVTIKRSFDYYLSIENIQKDVNGNKMFIRIGPQEYMLFKNGLEEAISWFTDSKYSTLYVRDRGNLVMTTPIPEKVISGLPMQRYIRISPTIIDKGMSSADKEPGIRLELGDPSSITEINLDRLMGLYYIVSCFNMYQAALTMINYLQRPEFGTNRFNMDTGRTLPVNDGVRYGASGIEGRVITPKGTINNIEALE